jgi:hypothetical protein
MGRAAAPPAAARRTVTPRAARTPIRGRAARRVQRGPGELVDRGDGDEGERGEHETHVHAQPPAAEPPTHGTDGGDRVRRRDDHQARGVEDLERREPGAPCADHHAGGAEPCPARHVQEAEPAMRAARGAAGDRGDARGEGSAGEGDVNENEHRRRGWGHTAGGDRPRPIPKAPPTPTVLPTQVVEGQRDPRAVRVPAPPPTRGGCRRGAAPPRRPEPTSHRRAVRAAR